MAWTWPLAPIGDRLPTISNGYGMQSNGVFHPGADVMFRRIDGEPNTLPLATDNFIIPVGTQAIAFDDGIVEIAQNITTGGYVKINHGNSLYSQYMHLDPVGVSAGQSIVAGAVVGTVGHDVSPGAYGLNHLHFQLSDGTTPFDPAPYLSQASYAAPVAESNLLTYLLIGGFIYAVYKLV